MFSALHKLELLAVGLSCTLLDTIATNVNGEPIRLWDTEQHAHRVSDEKFCSVFDETAPPEISHEQTAELDVAIEYMLRKNGVLLGDTPGHFTLSVTFEPDSNLKKRRRTVTDHSAYSGKHRYSYVCMLCAYVMCVCVCVCICTCAYP